MPWCPQCVKHIGNWEYHVHTAMPDHDADVASVPELKAGDVVEFLWMGDWLTGILVTHPKEGKWLTIRTKGREFQVPPTHVVAKTVTS